jgi:hypothetical protein
MRQFLYLHIIAAYLKRAAREPPLQDNYCMGASRDARPGKHDPILDKNNKLSYTKKSTDFKEFRLCKKISRELVIYYLLKS